MEVHREVFALRINWALAAAAAYMAVNERLLHLWVGSEFFGGSLLTVLLGLQFVVSGQSFLVNYLYRATGPVLRGSFVLAGEAFLRVSLAVVLLHALGLPGIPIAGLVAGATGWLISSRLTREHLGKNVVADSGLAPMVAGRVWGARGLAVVVGILLVVTLPVTVSWAALAVLGIMVALVTGISLMLVDPSVMPTRRFVLESIFRRSARSG